MGLFDLLRRWFGGGPPERDISTLGTGDDSAATREVVSTRPEPLKPKHLRMTHRDPRLLPKKRAVWPAKRKRVLERAEADRLFGGTLRTADRSIRDLATDEAQLKRYDLPVWRAEEDVAAALGLTIGQLRHFSIHRERETTPHYVTFAIPKRGGGQRLIQAPKRRLKAIQRKLHEQLVSRLPVSPFAHGFRRQRSVLSNAAPHARKAIVLKFDLRDCFPTIHYGRVRGLLIALGYSYPVAATLAVLMTEAPRQPVVLGGTTYHVPVGRRACVQGAPTSPGLCNAILSRLDRRLAGLGQRYGYGYTRYADDLTLSGDDPSALKPLMSLVARFVAEEGFTLRREKTRVLRRGGRQQVTGVTVNDGPGLSRRERRRLRAEIHRLRRDGGDERAWQRLRGKLAYLRMLNPDQAEPLLRRAAD